MLDYWGLSLKQAAEALRAHLAARGETPPAGRKWKVAVCGPHPGAQVALGDAFEPTWEPKGADFALMLGEFYCARLDAPAIARIERASVTFARVHDIRGRDRAGPFHHPTGRARQSRVAHPLTGRSRGHEMAPTINRERKRRDSEYSPPPPWASPP